MDVTALRSLVASSYEPPEFEELEEPAFIYDDNEAARDWLYGGAEHTSRLDDTIAALPPPDAPAESAQTSSSRIWEENMYINSGMHAEGCAPGMPPLRECTRQIHGSCSREAISELQRKACYHSLMRAYAAELDNPIRLIPHSAARNWATQHAFLEPHAYHELDETLACTYRLGLAGRWWAAILFRRRAGDMQVVESKPWIVFYTCFCTMGPFGAKAVAMWQA